MKISYEANKKVFNYGDCIVIIDFKEHRKIVKHFCGCCKIYSVEMFQFHAICHYCANRRMAE